MAAHDPRPLDTTEEQRAKHGRPTAPVEIDGDGLLLINLARGSVFALLNDDNISTFTIEGAETGWPTAFTLLITADGSGYTQDWGGVLWPAGTAPTLTETADEVDVLTFAWDGSRWFGFVQGQAFAAP